MIGTKFYKGQFSDEEYADCAVWCTNTQLATIEDKGDYFECVALPAPTAEEIAEQELQQKKSDRAEAVSRITVEVDDMVFDGDEKAQERMSRAVSTARARADRLYNKAIAEWLADQPEGTLVDVSQSGIVKDDYMTYETTWVLADSTYTTVTISQLSEACELAGQMQTELWIKPYE